jgi:alpha-galactosidase
MGWSSWNVFAADVNEAKIMSVIDAMVSLKSAGYEYIK